MKIIDVNFALGGIDASGATIDEKYALNFMQDFGISRAICYHEHAILDPKDGNVKMKSISEKSGGKIGTCAVLDPILGADNLPGDGDLASRLCAFNPDAVRIFPSDCRVPFHPIYWEDILSATKISKTPIIIDGTYTMDFFSNIPQVLEKYSENKFVLLRQGACEGRRIMPLLKAFNNVYFTIERMLDNMQIEEIAERFGCDRILFASDHPKRRIEGALGLAMYAEIENSEREKILCKNWEDISK